MTPKEVREFVGAMAYINAIEGYFVTTSHFSSQCIDFSQKLPVHLIDKTMLMELIITAEELFREPIKDINANAEETIRMYLSLLNR